MRKNEWIRAALLGVASGLVGVALFVVVLNFVGKEEVKEEVLPVQQEVIEEENASFYASQHGLFSSKEGAQQFIAENPLLNKAAIIEVNQQFFVWSALATNKQPESLTPSAFFKQLSVVAGCTEPTLQKLPEILMDEKYLKNYFEQTPKEGEVPADWGKILTAVSSLSNDINVMRLHLLVHYYGENDCLKIEF
ncbi:MULTISPECIES: hypothetical protein [Bacillales]|uniref:Uncharacterized protein n=1 Tax=Lysinibacillus louembei TaxID=1470088 RepID=A0ABZ0RRE4_9BACI|nr:MULTISPECIES: hypothetical protein [Bacillales]MCT6925455.1 hypothetical protein [Metasolibacillus sp.]MCT6941711.1 hypothetical protein [Metasolibacillus sp.]WPK10797.1 hypothetical protein R6U77_12995 [Lysinibacillus louembei]